MCNKLICLRLTKQNVFINYTYIVIDEGTGDAVIIDPAWEFGKIEDELSRNNAKTVTVLLTHSHIDHVNLVEEFEKKYNSKIYMSREEIDYYNFRCNHLHSFDANGRYMIGSISIEVYLTPGHTAGSTSYVIGSNLFTGDTLFIEGCGLCWGKGADPEKMFYSLAMLKERIPGNFHVYPSHSYGEKPGLTFAYILLNNIYLNITDVNRFIEFRMRKNQNKLFAFI